MAHNTRALVRVGVLVMVVLALAAAPANAQGKGNGRGKVKGGSGPVTSGSASPASSGSGIAIRQFGAWLDDASLLAPGDAWTSITFGHYRSFAGSQTDFPVVDAASGSPGAHSSASPFRTIALASTTARAAVGLATCS